jgi:outer membrane protein TolC
MSRKRWVKRVLAGLLAVGSAGGCQRQLFLEPADYNDAVLGALPRGLQTEPHSTITPSVVNPAGGPADVLNSNLPPRMITLQECIAIALEQGNTGIQTPNNFGIKIDTPNQFGGIGGGGIGGTDAIRAFALDPARASVNLERSLSKFDARWINSMTWQKVDQPTAAQFLSFQNSRDVANLTSTLAKPLPTGGIAGITFTTDYSKFANQVSGNQFVNPNYIPRLQFTFEQPLLRLFGVEANQLTPSHPGSQLLNVQPTGGAGTEGILISRIRVDQQKAEFDRDVNYLLANVEAAYWNLYAAYYNLYAQEEGLRQAFEGYRFISTRVEIGTDPPQNRDQARAQFERFRRLVYQARGQVLESERQLRGFMGLRSDDGHRLVPIDNPNEAPYRPDFYEAANEAITNRPELLQARQDLKVNQLNLLLQKNLRQPDLRLVSQYDIAGLGTRLDGSEFLPNGIPGNALASLASNRFNNWTVGLRMDIPIGFRDANGLVRDAELRLARSFFQLRDSEMKTLEYLVQQWRRVIETHAEIGPARAERQALQIYLGRVQEVIKIGRWDATYYQNYLTVQRDLATAIATEFQAIADYNKALAFFEFAKGTIQQYNNVRVGEGPLPPWVQQKAADHIRERTESALKLRERDLAPPPVGPGVLGGTQINPAGGQGVLPDLPPFAEKREPLPDSLPEPKPIEPKDGKMPLPVPPGGAALNPPRGLPPLPPASPPAEGDYFRPSGTTSLPPREPRTPPAAPPAVPAVPPASAPTASDQPGLALPVPPADAALPVPPAAPRAGGVAAPVGLPAIPEPPSRPLGQ